MRRTTRVRAQELVLGAAITAGVYVCYRLLLPFVPALAWALTFAVLFAPAHRWAEVRLRSATAAAAIAVTIVGAIVVVPGVLVAGRLVEEATRATVAIGAAINSGWWPRALDTHPTVAPLVERFARTLDLPDLIGGVAAWLTNTSASLVQGSITQVMGFFITFYFLFYFLRDKRSALAALLDLSPLTRAEMNQLTSRVADTIHGTLYGTIVCAAVQGTLGGLMFWGLGLPAPLLWGVIMGLLAIVPVFGAFIVWIPASAFLAIDGHWGKALLLAAWGSVVVGGIDNVLYPTLVGTRLRLHAIPAFVSVVGGLIVFGASGVVVGPLAVTMTLAVLEIWRARNRCAKAATPRSTRVHVSARRLRRSFSSSRNHSTELATTMHRSQSDTARFSVENAR